MPIKSIGTLLVFLTFIYSGIAFANNAITTHCPKSNEIKVTSVPTSPNVFYSANVNEILYGGGSGDTTMTRPKKEKLDFIFLKAAITEHEGSHPQTYEIICLYSSLGGTVALTAGAKEYKQKLYKTKFKTNPTSNSCAGDGNPQNCLIKTHTILQPIN